MRRLSEEVQPRQWTICTQVCIYVTVLPIPVLCVQQASYHKRLRTWLDALNRDVLVRQGMYAKLQTASVHADKYHEEISWLAVALDEKEAAQLRAEPIFWAPTCCDERIQPACGGDSCACCCFTPRVV
jgi:hypothetical protein